MFKKAALFMMMILIIASTACSVKAEPLEQNEAYGYVLEKYFSSDYKTVAAGLKQDSIELTDLGMNNYMFTETVKGNEVSVYIGFFDADVDQRLSSYTDEPEVKNHYMNYYRKNWFWEADAFTEEDFEASKDIYEAFIASYGDPEYVQGMDFSSENTCNGYAYWTVSEDSGAPDLYVSYQKDASGINLHVNFSAPLITNLR